MHHALNNIGLDKINIKRPHHALTDTAVAEPHLKSVFSVLACIMMAAGNSSNGRCPATYFYSSTSGLVGKWLYDHYLKLMNNCVR